VTDEKVREKEYATFRKYFTAPKIFSFVILNNKLNMFRLELCEFEK